MRQFRSFFALFTTAIVMLLGAQTASAAPTPIAMPDFVDMAVDEAHGSVYLTGGAATSAITVLNLDGSPKTTIEGVVGARDIVRSHDGAALYVAIWDQHAIGMIDPATNTITKTTLGANVCPESLAQVGGVIWFSYMSCSEGIRHLASMRLSDANVVLDLGTAFYGLLASSPTLPGRVVVDESGVLVLLDVSGGHGIAPVRGPSVHTDAVRHMAIAADGSEIIVAGFPPSPSPAHAAYSTVDLTQTNIYGGSSTLQPASVAARGDGVVATGLNRDYNPNISIYTQGQSTPWRTYEPGPGTYLMPRGLEFGSENLYVVMGMLKGVPGRWFQRITPRRATSLTLTSSASTYEYAATVTVSVHLTTGSPNRTVSIYAQPYGGSKTLIRSGTVDASGNLTASLRVARRTTFSATYDGDAGYDPAQATRTLLVRARAKIAITKVVGTSSYYKLVRSGSQPFAIGTITPKAAGACARLQLQEPSGTSWAYNRTSKCWPMDSYGRVTTWFNNTWPPGSRFRIRVIWGGNIKNAPKNSSWAYVRFVR